MVGQRECLPPVYSFGMRSTLLVVLARQRCPHACSPHVCMLHVCVQGLAGRLSNTGASGGSTGGNASGLLQQAAHNAFAAMPVIGLQLMEEARARTEEGQPRMDGRVGRVVFHLGAYICSHALGWGCRHLIPFVTRVACVQTIGMRGRSSKRQKMDATAAVAVTKAVARVVAVARAASAVAVAVASLPPPLRAAPAVASAWQRRR